MSKTKSISPAICSENVKNANLKKGFIGFHITNISLENMFHRIQNPACELN